MGLFDKIKKMFTKEEKEPRVEEKKLEIKEELDGDEIEEVITKEEKHKKYHKTEFRFGETSRTLYFPENIKTEEANAKMENGVLKIRLPKEEKDHEKKSKLNIE